MNTVNAVGATQVQIQYQPWLNAAAAPAVPTTVRVDTIGAMTVLPPLTTISVASGWPPIGATYDNFTTGR